jgi:methionyl aminopeptidase
MWSNSTSRRSCRAIHEQPTAPNFYDPSQKAMLTEGLVLTIEPIISERPRRSDRRPSADGVADTARIVQDDDGWTLRTDDGSLAAHYEHTVIITKGVPIIVTKREDRGRL